MSPEPLVSVVIATYNASEYIGDTVGSVRAQEFTDFELLACDDASRDETPALVERLSREDPRIRLLRRTQNRGAASTRNLGIGEAKGRFVAFLDADDLWMPEKLGAQLRFMSDTNAAISFTAYGIIDQHGRPTGQVVDAASVRQVGYRGMLRKAATMGCSTVIVDRARVGDFRMPDLRTGQDYATWLSILKRGHVAYCLPRPLTQYRITPGSISRNKVKKARRQWQIYREVEKLSLPDAMVCFAFYAHRAVFRR